MNRNAHDRQYTVVMAVDILMVALLIANLLLISFDWLYTAADLSHRWAAHAPGVFRWYEQRVHDHFLLIDLGFIAVFLTEFFLRWVIAVVRQHYSKWFFYPFIHWYDLLGCIPLSAFRVVRILRVFSIVYRLYRLGILRIDRSPLFRLARKYYEILLEELTDRVVDNIIGEMQAEVKEAGPTLDHIVKNVLRPKKAPLVAWMSDKLAIAVGTYQGRREADIRKYVEQSIAAAFRKNGELRRLEQIPVAGKAISQTLERSIANIVHNIIDGALSDLASSKNRVVVDEIAEMALLSVEQDATDDTLHALFLDTVNEVLESIRKQVAHTKRWKEKERLEKLLRAEAL